MTVKTRKQIGKKDFKPSSSPSTSLSRRLLYLTAALCALVAGLYFLIGFEVLSVLEPSTGQRAFGLIAGSGYAVATLALLVIRRRWLYITGALLQAFIIFQYFSLASARVPAYEVWGLLIRLPQALIFLALLYLIFSSFKERSN